MKAINHIQKELEDLNILLPKINEAKFKVPENYFEGFEQQLQSEIYVNSLPKVNPFQVPENYFQNFTVNGIKNIESKNSLKVSYKKTIQQGIAASIALALGFSVFNFVQTSKPQTIVNTTITEMALQKIDDATIQNYFENNFDENDIDALTNNADFDKIENEILSNPTELKNLLSSKNS